MTGRLLLDTHTDICAIEPGPAKLPADIVKTIEEGADHVLASLASIWVIAIKNGLPSNLVDNDSRIDVTAAEAAQQVGRTVSSCFPSHRITL